jgi:non-specific serine/threonine protein kinase
VLAGVDSLLAKSLVRRDQADEPRIGMLETIREFALEQLAACGEERTVRQAHAAFFLMLAEEAEPALTGPAQFTWLDRLDAEHANLRAALGWFLERGDAGRGLRLAASLQWYWHLRGHFSEGRRWLAAMLALPGADEANATRARALHGAGHLAHFQGDVRAAQPLLEASATLWQELGDRRGRAYALHWLGRALQDQGEHAAARARFEESVALFRTVDDPWGLSLVLGTLGTVLVPEDEAAESLAHESVALARTTGDAWALARALTQLGMLLARRGEYARAGALFDEQHALALRLGNKRFASMGLFRHAWFALRRHDRRQAAALVAESLRLVLDEQNVRNIADGLDVMAMAGLPLDPLRAALLFGAADALRASVHASVAVGWEPERARAVDAIRAAHDADTVGAAWEAGRALTLEAAVAEAVAFAARVATEPITAHAPHARPYPDDLTEREIDVLRLLAAGRSNREIAELLVISVRTAEHHVASIYEKVGAEGATARAAATAYAFRHGLAAPPSGAAP